MINNIIKRFFRKNKINLFFLTIISFVTQGINIFLPILSAALIDELVSKKTNNSIKIIFTFSFLLCLKLILEYYFKIFQTREELNLQFSLQKGITEQYYLSRFTDNNEQKLTVYSQNIIDDTNTISTFIINNMFDWLNNILILIFSFVILFYLNIWFFLTAFLSVPLYVIISNFIQPKVKLAMEKSKKTLSSYNSGIIQIFQNLFTIKIFSIKNSMEQFENNLALKKNKNYLIAYKLVYLFYSVGGIITVIVQISYFFIGIKLIVANKLTVGEFSIVLSIYEFLLGSIEYFFSFFEKYAGFKASLDRVNDTNQNLKQKKNFNSSNLVSLREKIVQLKVTCFSWKFSNGKTLNFPDLFLKKGDILMLKGENGVGKTTLLNIITGVYPTPEKKIKFNNFFIEELNTEELRKNYIAFSDSNPSFIEETPLQNIRFFLDNPELSYNNIIDLMNKKGLDKIYGKLESILNKPIAELSTGQKKVISLLIAFLKESDVIFLDEPTLGLDTSKKKMLSDYINKIRQNKIIIIISHENFFEECFNNLITAQISN